MPATAAARHRPDTNATFWVTLRGPALLCALAVLACILLGRPYAATGIVDDWSYIRSAQLLAQTGHIQYNGWANPLLGWQLYFAAALFKIFGFSFTAARASTWIVAMAAAFLLQRILVRFGANERNATLGTIAVVLSPLFLMLSTVFMTDIQGFFAILLSLYGCQRALVARSTRTEVGWIAFAVVAGGLIGTSRQTGWLGLLLMVPATLWQLRQQKNTLLAGAALWLLGLLWVFGCLHWAKQQPYFISEPLFKPTVATGLQTLPVYPQGMAMHVVRQFLRSFLEMPLLLPVLLVFLPGLFRLRTVSRIAALACLTVLLLLAFHWRTSHPDYLLQPTAGNWIGIHALVEAHNVFGHGPVVLGTGVRLLLTALALGSLMGFFLELQRWRKTAVTPLPQTTFQWKQILVLLVPFTMVYIVLLIPRSALELFDRYTLPAMLLPLVICIGLFQERIRPRLPAALLAVLAVWAAYGVCCIHNTYALSRAMIATDQRLQQAGVPQGALDVSFDYGGWIELQKYRALDEPRITNPPNSYQPLPVTVDPQCWTPEVLYRYLQPKYGLSYDPNRCLGRADFAPGSFTVWPTGQTATLYVVKYTPLPR